MTSAAAKGGNRMTVEELALGVAAWKKFWPGKIAPPGTTGLTPDPELSPL